MYPAQPSRSQGNRLKPINQLPQKTGTLRGLASGLTKKASSHTVDFRVPAKYDFANREIAAPISARLIIESTQRPFVRPLAKPRRVFFVAIGLLV
jgi:hypothetical protein